jgi:hypothetical protein
MLGAPPSRPRPPDEDQEGGLEGVLDVMRIAEDPSADVQDHRPVALHQYDESVLIGGVEEAVEESGIGAAAPSAPVEEGLQVSV